MSTRSGEEAGESEREEGEKDERERSLQRRSSGISKGELEAGRRGK
jgi:hypothetical protein